MCPVVLFWLRLLLQSFVPPPDGHCSWAVPPSVYFTYCTLIVSALAVFFRIITPKFPALYVALLCGSDKAGLQDCGVMASAWGFVTLAIVHDDPATVILL